MIMRDFSPICEKYNSINLKIRYKWRDKEAEVTLRDILPRNFCLPAFHGVYPYMVTFFKGGWISWVNYDESVIVNCPSPEGVAMYVKCARGSNPPDNFNLEIMQTNCKCYKKYNLRDTFPVNFSEERALQYTMLDKIVPFLAAPLSGQPMPRDFSCLYNGNVVEYHVELVE